MTEDPPLGEGVIRAGESFGIGNEFTGVRVRKVWTRQGERLELFVPRHGYRIMLDAMQLEIVAAQDPERFSALFAVALGAAGPAEPAGDTRGRANGGGPHEGDEDGGEV